VVSLFEHAKPDAIHRLSGEADHSRVLLHGALSPNPPNGQSGHALMRVLLISQELIEGRKTMRLFILGTLVSLCFLSVGKNAQASEPESLQPSTTQAEGTINQTNANKLNRISSIDRLVMKYAVESGLDPDLIHTVITIESGYKPLVRNGNAVGLMQIVPATARGLGYRGDAKGLFDPEINIKYGVKYLALAYQLSHGDLCKTLMRYQSGHDARRMNAANRAYCAKAKIVIASLGN
jgi:soluble lytic murein transglycosylase-like protein